ncbi:exodeoxyribonuclease V subunit alpha [Buchnera aphidicola]|uniref:exodeoxyribonuclease V subunit alpha n=1 Tax=Buchnera aphidicola TaxID=9 RepID=UPI0031B6E792
MLLSKKNFLRILKKSKIKKIIQEIDFYCIKTLLPYFSIKKLLIILILNYESNKGNTCLSIKYFSKNHILKKKIQKLQYFWNIIKNIKLWNNKKNLPYIIKKKYIYLSRYWKQEKKILKFFKNKTINYTRILKKYSKIYKNFNFKNIDKKQKLAIGIILFHKISFLIGGPGTGKTTILAYILIILIKTTTHTLKIALTALTGKATTHLTNTIYKILHKQKFSSLENKKYLITANTLHKTLLIQKNFIINKKYKKKINFDLLIIDEASMLDTNIMEILCQRISLHTKIIFSGDINQLQPIETASILKEICYFAKNTYNPIFSQYISIFTKQKLKICKKISEKNIKNSIVILKKNYRFNTNNMVIKFTKILENKKKIFLKDLIFLKNTKNFILSDISTEFYYKKMLKSIKNLYQKHWKLIKKKNNNFPLNIKKILKNFQKNRVLCAIKDGYFGEKFLNNFLDNIFFQKNNLSQKKSKIWYHGKIILITKNNFKLKLFNGIIGICILYKKKYKIFFQSSNNTIFSINPILIKNFQSAWVMTIHKSQGSEFKNVILIFPNKYYSIMNKELFYTALTRTKKKIKIYINNKIMLKIINNIKKKKSGLHKNF